MTKEEVSQAINKFLRYLHTNGVDANTCIVVVNLPGEGKGVHAHGNIIDCKYALLALLADEQGYNLVSK